MRSPGGRHLGRMLRRVAPLGALLLASCELPTLAVPEAPPGFAVFGVLNPSVVQQQIFLMRTREIAPDTTGLTFLPDDPIASSGETPVSGARVVIYGPSGDSAVAVEDRTRRADGRGAGVYRIWGAGNPAAAPPGAFIPVRQGNLYRLRVTTDVGEAVAHTRVPRGTPTLGPSRTLDLSADSLIMPDPSAEAAGFVYSLRSVTLAVVDGVQQYRRQLERRLVLPPPSEDWAFAYARESLQGAIRVVFTVTAVDSSYLAYYGRESDPFADRSSGTSLRGAAGVFGSALVLYSVQATVREGTAP